jgi:HAD superfamily hydrolase (TIGR01509 family)
MNIKAVIFDMDGVIVDSEPIESLAWERVLAEYGVKPIFNSWGLIHSPGAPTIDYVIEKHKLINHDIDTIKIKKRMFFEEIVLAGVSSLPGVATLIKKFKKAKIKIGLASSRNESQVKITIRELGFAGKFEQVIGFSEDVKRKPAPDIYLKVAKLLNVEPSTCVAIEDTENGIKSAKAAGMKVIAAPNRWTEHQDFAKADKIVNNLSEITILMLKNL